MVQRKSVGFNDDVVELVDTYRIDQKKKGGKIPSFSKAVNSLLASHPELKKKL